MQKALVLSVASAAFAALAVIACGSDTTRDSPGAVTGDDGGPMKQDATTAPSTGDAASDAAPGDAAQEASGPLLAPLITLIQPTDAGVKLGWENNTPDCDAVKGERKTALETYKEVFSVSGTTTTTVDTSSPSVANPTYTNCTFRLYCLRAGAMSPYSNEQSVSCLKP